MDESFLPLVARPAVRWMRIFDATNDHLLLCSGSFPAAAEARDMKGENKQEINVHSNQS
jgi:hypothetical protein